MHKTLPYLALFAVVVLLQVFLFDNLSISIYLNPLVYVAFIALLPLDTPPAAVLGAGLALGVTMDFAMGAAGINTIATLLIAFLRPTLAGMICGRDHSTFLSFAPKDNPKIAISVYVENGGFGASAALPIASLLEEYYLTDTIRRPELLQYIKDMNIYYPAYDK